MSAAAFGLGDEDASAAEMELQRRLETKFGDKETFKKYLSRVAGTRNAILYATKNGLPDSKWDDPDDQFLKQCSVNAACAIGVACLILQHPERKRLIVEQILNGIIGYLKLSDGE